MKKILISAFAIAAFTACSDKKTETEETTITTETTTDLSEPGPDENSTTVTKTVETDTSEMSVTVGEAQRTAIDSSKRKQ